MDTLLQDLRSAFAVAVTMSLGLTLQNGPAPRTPPRRHDPPAARATHLVPPPHRTLSWMDYIDFRRGSGDVLRWIGPSTLTDESTPERADHPHNCGTGE